MKNEHSGCASRDGYDDLLGQVDALQRRCDAYEAALEDIRDDSGHGKESGLRAETVLTKWQAHNA